MYMYVYTMYSTCTNVHSSLCPDTCVVDVRRLTLSGGVSVSVVVRAGEPYLLKVELPAILPSHSRDVLETIRRVSVVTVAYMDGRVYRISCVHIHKIYKCPCTCTVHVHLYMLSKFLYIRQLG